jgi:hypothetical protein
VEPDAVGPNSLHDSYSRSAEIYDLMYTGEARRTTKLRGADCNSLPIDRAKGNEGR